MVSLLGHSTRCFDRIMHYSDMRFRQIDVDLSPNKGQFFRSGRQVSLPHGLTCLLADEVMH